MKQTKLIAPSILTADFSNLLPELLAVEEEGCPLLHLDVMDGHFVPNLSFGPMLISSLRKDLRMGFDMHLMISDPENYLKAFAEAAGGGKYASAQPNGITFHVEAVKEPGRLIEKIRADFPELRVGLALNPLTPLSSVEPYLSLIDMALVMTVEPGFGGQSMRGEALEKIPALRALSASLNPDLKIEVDGGIKVQNLESVAGADVLVMGSAVFRGGSAEDAGRRYREASAALAALDALAQ